MEELSIDEFDEILRTPQSKTRKAKKFDRSIHTWFYDILTVLGQCENPDCADPRKRKTVHVWEHESGMKMCRHCFFAGWEPDAEDN